MPAATLILLHLRMAACVRGAGNDQANAFYLALNRIKYLMFVMYSVQ